MLEQLTVEFIAFSLIGILGVGAILLWGVAKKGVKTALTTPKHNQSSSTGHDSLSIKENGGRDHLRKPLPAINESPFYEQAFNESDGGAEARHLATWAKAFALTEGDETKTKAKYIELRVADLVSEECERVKNKHREEIRSHLDARLNELINIASSLNMTEAQRIFAAKYPTGQYLPILMAYYGGRVSRMSSESDSQYARRLARFTSDFEKDTGRKLSDIYI